MTRELDLCNPLGIEREPGTTWIGQSEDQPDATLVKFIDFAHGIRAGVVTLRTYATKYGITTIGPAIERFSPPPANDTAAYIADVCTRCQASADTEIAPILPQFLRALCQHENGPVPSAIVTAEDIAQGIALASE